MLVLSRNIGQSIMIGDDIEVMVVNSGGSKVCIGINAPKNIAVHREELFQKIKDQEEEKHNNSFGIKREM